MNSGLDITLPPELMLDQLFHVFPKKLAPILVFENDKLILKLSQYGLIPAWSKAAKLKFATHNARIESIKDKPTWKKPFLSKHCLVPIDEFREPVRVGPHANHVISFKSENNRSLHVAGLYDEWCGDNNEPIHSFAIITTTATPFILSMGHERSPLILDVNLASDWLKQKVDAEVFLSMLTAAKQPEYLLVNRVRQLKPKI